MNQSKLAIITTVYNNYTVLHDFFESLQNQSCLKFKVFLADSSSDKRVIEKTSFPIHIQSIENRGYAGGVNNGLKQALSEGFQYFCVINNDVIVQKDFVEAVLSSLQKHKKTLVGGKIWYAPGFEFHTKRYSNDEHGKVIWYAGGTVDWKHALTNHIGVDTVDIGQYDKTCNTEFITGCCITFDKNVYELLGFWDEAYFLYFEDADYCERAKKKNLQLLFDPSIQLWHKNAQSSDGSGSNLHVTFQKKARLRFALKFAPLRTKLHILKNYFFSS